MATTRWQSLEERVQFACRNHFLAPGDVRDVAELLRKEDPLVLTLGPREFGKRARIAVGTVFDRE